MTPAEAQQRAVEAAAREWLGAAFDDASEECRVDWLREMTAAIQVWEAALWQPIASAPGDGTHVLVFAPPSGNEYPAMVQRIDMWRSGGWWQMRPAQPYTHWRPLPAGPGDAP